MTTLLLLLGVVVHTVVIYAFLVAGLCAVGRRLMAQLSLIDYLIIALLGSAVESGLYLGGGSFWAGIVSGATLLLANRALATLTGRYPGFRQVLEGSPIVLVLDGEMIDSELGRVHVTPDDVLAAIRLHGYDELEAVRFAVMETNGDITVVPRRGRQKGGGGQ